MNNRYPATIAWFDTDFGQPIAGPVVLKYLNEVIEPGLAENYRTKAHKQAKARLRQLEQAINTLAGVYFAVNDDLRQTP